MVNLFKFFFLSILTSLTCLGQLSAQTTLTVCWDTSFSMKERQLGKELSFLDSLITKMNVKRVQLLNFSNDVQEKNFLFENGNWSALRETLSKSVYDGSTNYQRLNQVTKNDINVVFTDGNKIFDDDFLSLDEGDILVNTSLNADYETLQLWEFLNRANLFDYAYHIRREDDKNEDGSIAGFVYLDAKPLPNALIRSSSGQSFVTDAAGLFQFSGNIGDTLRIMGAKDNIHELVIDDQENGINFFLDSKTVALDEVIVTEKQLEELNLVDMGYTTMEQKKVGFSVYNIPEERISEVEVIVTDVLQEVPGLQMGTFNTIDPRNSGLSTARMRGKSSMFFDSKVLVVIDGTPLQRSNNNRNESNANYFHINPQNIKSMKVLKGLAATNLYGSEGGGGVILITTKTASVGKASNGKPVDQARLTNNIFEGKLVSKKGQLNIPYLKELKKSKNLKEAYRVYLEQREDYQSNPWYYIDVSNYFRTANSQLADRVLSNLTELTFTYEAHRTLFFKYLTIKKEEEALALAELMLKDHPNRIQTYLDVATAYRNLGNYQMAAELLNGMVTGGLNAEIDFNPLKKIAGTELRNLVNRHRNKVDLLKIDSNFKNNLTYNARLRFDWASPQNEFTLKFVNPQNRFFDWEHSSIADKSRIKNEIQGGFYTEQFDLVGDMAKGKWGIYITNLSANNSKEPYWVKCTVDYNFGKPNQKSEERIIRMDPDYSKEKLFFEFVVN